jgi:hypothetical protein
MSLKAVFFSNSSWQGKHPFQMSRADFKLTLYRFLKQFPTHERPEYYSLATFTPLLPTRWSDHLSMQTPVRITSLDAGKDGSRGQDSDSACCFTGKHHRRITTLGR